MAGFVNTVMSIPDTLRPGIYRAVEQLSVFLINTLHHGISIILIVSYIKLKHFIHVADCQCEVTRHPPYGVLYT
jgi:hypothetical protein